MKNLAFILAIAIIIGTIEFVTASNEQMKNISTDGLIMTTKNIDPAEQRRGCCSHHGGVCGCDSSTGRIVCCDGTLSPSCMCR